MELDKGQCSYCWCEEGEEHSPDCIYEEPPPGYYEVGPYDILIDSKREVTSRAY